MATLIEQVRRITSTQSDDYFSDDYILTLLNRSKNHIIELAIEDIKLTEEMEKVLAPYLPQEEEDYQLDVMNELLVTEDNYKPE